MSITDFLVICSGANRNVLAQRPDTIERRRATAIGASVLLTGLFAFVTAAYVVYLSFYSGVWAATLGLTWGAMLFTIDRLLVVGVPQPSNRRLSPLERVREKRRAFLVTIPRLALAAIIALPIAVPLQLRFFEREINMELERQRSDTLARVRFEIDRMYPELLMLDANNEELRRSVTEREKRVNELQDAMLQDQSGNKAAKADRLFAYLQARKDLEELRRSVEQQVAANNARLKTIRQERDVRMRKMSHAIDVGSPTVLARLDALNSLKARNKLVAQASATILLLFIVVQMTPVLMQLLAGSNSNAELWEAVSDMANMSHVPLSPEAQRPDSVTVPAPHKAGDTPQQGDEVLHVFMNHCSEDKPVVRALTQQLREAHVDVWLDEERLRPGQRWEDEITTAVRNSDAVIICLSHRAVRKRGFVQREIRYALEVAAEQPEGSIFLIPAKLDECDAPLTLRPIQYVRMYEPNGYPLFSDH